MPRKDFIYNIFNEKHDEELFPLRKEPEYSSSLHTQGEMCTKLFKFIYDCLKSKEICEELKKLIDDFVSAIYDTNLAEIKLFYYYGFLDGMDFNT